MRKSPGIVEAVKKKNYSIILPEHTYIYFRLPTDQPHPETHRPTTPRNPATTQNLPPGENRSHTFWQITSHPRIASRMARKDRESEYNHDTHN